ncbi:MAG: hypothetical protein QM762_09145 [Chryseolinea sp.]
MQNHSIAKSIYFLTGASGVGKTTLVNFLEKKCIEKPWVFFHFDSIGIPSVSKMNEEYGSPSEWQKAKTFEWIDRLIALDNEQNILIEGQVNLQFIRDGFLRHNFRNYRIVLADCSVQDMGRRLTGLRNQPDLFTADMRRWREFLRQQADELKADIIDTSSIGVSEAASVLENLLNSGNSSRL